MIVGVPGAGIGGLFYLACALWAPVRELWFVIVLRRPPRLPRLVMRQAATACGIIAGIWLTGWLFGLLAIDPLPDAPAPRPVAASERLTGGADGSTQTAESGSVLVRPGRAGRFVARVVATRAAVRSAVTARMLLVGLVTLSSILLSVQVLRIIVRPDVSRSLPRNVLPRGVGGPQPPDSPRLRRAWPELG